MSHHTKADQVFLEENNPGQFEDEPDCHNCLCSKNVHSMITDICYGEPGCECPKYQPAQ